MIRSLDADVTIAYVQELAKQWRWDEAYFREMRGHQHRAETARAKAVVLEELIKQLDQWAVTVKVA